MAPVPCVKLTAASAARGPRDPGPCEDGAWQGLQGLGVWQSPRECPQARGPERYKTVSDAPIRGVSQPE